MTLNYDFFQINFPFYKEEILKGFSFMIVDFPLKSKILARREFLSGK